METIDLKNNIHLFTLKAASFPHDVPQAHAQLKEMLATEDDRSFYGISFPDRDHEIQYWAAANTMHAGETAQRVESFTVESGPFAMKVVRDWKTQVNKVQEAFQELIAHPACDPKGYCLEQYSGDDVRCLVPLVKEYKPEQGGSLSQEIEATFDKLCMVLAGFDDHSVNQVPFEGSWTAGQVTEHVIASVSMLPDAHTKPCNRFHDEKVLPLRTMFLDFTIKMKSPDFILPTQAKHNKGALLETLGEIKRKHQMSVDVLDMTALCMDFEFPGLGYLTRYEWIWFFLVHTQRHTRQLENIFDALKVQTPASASSNFS